MPTCDSRHTHTHTHTHTHHQTSQRSSQNSPRTQFRRACVSIPMAPREKTNVGSGVVAGWRAWIQILQCCLVIGSRFSDQLSIDNTWLAGGSRGRYPPPAVTGILAGPSPCTVNVLLHCLVRSFSIVPSRHRGIKDRKPFSRWREVSAENWRWEGRCWKPALAAQRNGLWMHTGEEINVKRKERKAWWVTFTSPWMSTFKILLSLLLLLLFSHRIIDRKQELQTNSQLFTMMVSCNFFFFLIQLKLTTLRFSLPRQIGSTRPSKRLELNRITPVTSSRRHDFNV